jgi:hypothetical protein
MRRVTVLIGALGFALFAGILAVNIFTPPDNAQRVVDYALPPTPQTAGGSVLPAWRKPVNVVIITDEVGDNPFSSWIKEFLRNVANPETLIISEADLPNNNVGTGEGKFVICVCKDIVSVARNQLSENLEYQIPNEIERVTTLDRDEQNGAKGFLTIKIGSKVREIESATVYVTSNPTPDLMEEAAWYVLVALSPQLDYRQRVKVLTEGHGRDVELNDLGKLYMSVMLSKEVSPGMSREEFKKLVEAKLGPSG